MLYLMRNAMIVPVGKASSFSKKKTEHLTVQWENCSYVSADCVVHVQGMSRAHK